MSYMDLQKQMASGSTKEDLILTKTGGTALEYANASSAASIWI